VRALERHIGPGIIDVVLANNQVYDQPEGVEVVLAEPFVAGSTVEVAQADLADSAHPWRHDPQKLAAAVLKFARSA